MRYFSTMPFSQPIFILKNTHNGVLSRCVFWLIALVFFSLAAWFSVFYLTTGHDGLAKWFTHLNGCFYHNDNWSTDFFTPGIKSDGNMYSAIGLVLSMAGIIISIRRFAAICLPPGMIKPHERSWTVNIDPTYLLILLGACWASWRWGNIISAPAFDEVFSAQNAAGIHPFQCISYYMLPNNHMLFNLINDLVFHSAADKIATGRIISLVAYGSFILLMFYWLGNVFTSGHLGFVGAFVMSLQLFTWGFSFQARGYELYLLAQWCAVVGVFAYLSTQQQKWLWVNLFSLACGYFILPTMLYFHAAQTVFILLYSLVYKEKMLRFWKYQLAAVLLTFLLYLPALCFSGLEAFTRNPYVMPMGGAKTTGAFLLWAVPFFNAYLGHMFSGLQWGMINISLLLFILPVILLFSKKDSAYFRFGLFYVCLWLTLFIIVIVMRRMPFERNLIGHYSISLAGVLITLHWLGGLIRWKQKLVMNILLPAVFFACIAHFIINNPAYFKDALYEYNVNDTYLFNRGLVQAIPSGATVACSDQEFYLVYICRKNGCTVNKCPQGNEDYYTKHVSEALPVGYTGRYDLISDIYGYQVYKKK